MPPKNTAKGSSGSTFGIVIAVHGTRIKESSSAYDDIAKLVSKKTGAKVLIGYMKHGAPTIREAVERLANDGTEEIIVVPLFFVRGLHVSEDIPSLLSTVKAKITLAEPIGADERLADIIVEKIKTSKANIEKKSLEIIEKTFLRDYKPKKESGELEVVKRVVHAAGDPALKELLVFRNMPIKAGMAAVKRGNSIICDVKMVKAGVNSHVFEKFGVEVKCFIDHKRVKEFAEKNKKTRASSAFLLHKNEIKNSIAIVGNAPTALFELCSLIDSGIKPSLVIASPPGFVGAREAKEEILKRDVPAIVLKGERGGSAIAVAVANAIIKLDG